MVFGIFSKGFDPDSFEKELVAITDNITHTQSQIAGLQSRSARLTRKLSEFLFLGYILLNIYNYSQVPRGIVGSNRVQVYLKGQTSRQLAVLCLYPVVGTLLVRLVQWMFGVIVRGRTARLRDLRKKHATKIDKLKKITNFNTTNRLLTKYGNDDDKKKPQPAPGQKPDAPAATKTPVAQPPATANLNPQQQREIAKLNLSKPEASVRPPPQTNPIVGKKPRTIQDRLLDILIGSDNNESVESRYALICAHCFSHNGLAPPNCTDPSQVKYACWKCGVMNGNSAWDKELNQLKEAAENTSQAPRSAASPEDVVPDKGTPVTSQSPEVSQPIQEPVSDPVETLESKPGSTGVEPSASTHS